jgi:cellulose synthase operon protein C
MSSRALPLVHALSWVGSMKRRINLLVLMILFAAAVLLGGGMHLVHGVQVRRNAAALLDRASRAEASGDLEKAEQSLKQYLSFRRDDGPAWKRYAQLLDQRDPQGRRREQVFLVYEQALRNNPSDHKLERRCADLALELQRFSDAQRHLKKLLDVASEHSAGQPTGAEVAELEDLLGQCDRGLTRYELAEEWFRNAIKHDPARLACYDSLARLRRNELRRIETADAAIKEMVAKNPKAGRAYIFRWRFDREFAPAPDAGDLKKALELAPDDPEVLFTAAVASEQKQDSASARAYYRKGLKLDPKTTPFALNLARLEAREGHLDQAESVLRQADQANPSLDVAFELAETLIDQNKIDGKDDAASFIARLRDAGMGDTLVRYLEAKMVFQSQKWAEAIPKIEMAGAVLKSVPRVAVPLNLMLAECYRHVGSDEQRLNALRQAAAEGDRAPESVRIEFARALAQAGKLDQALIVLLPLAEHKPELRLDVVALLIQKASRLPRDPRNWQNVERQLRAAEKALTGAVEAITFLKVDMLVAQDRLDDARALLVSAQAKEPRNLRYHLALARLSQRQGKRAAALQILDQADKDLGPSLDIQLARLDYWGQEGGDTAKAAVARLAETRQQIPAADRLAFLDRLAMTEIRLREPALARQYYREHAALEPDNLRVRLGLFELAIEAGDLDDAAQLVSQIRKIEGDKGTHWRFTQAILLIDKARRGVSHDLEEARVLAGEISERQPDWWAGPTLKGELAELAGAPDQAIEHYLRAVELGNVQPPFARRLVGLLNQRNRFKDIEHLAQVLREQGVALNEITIIKALDATRKQDFDTALALARQVFPENSTNPSDHLALGRFYMSAARSDAAGKEFQRAVELGPGVPDSWVTYVQYLVQTKHLDQAKTAVEAAHIALPTDRATMTLAQCYMALGDLKRADELIGKSLDDEGKSADPIALKIATIVSLGRNRVDKVYEYLKRLDQVADLSPGDKAWTNRTRIALLLNKGRLADRDRALTLVDQNLISNPDSFEDQVLKATILALRPDRRGEAIKILEPMASTNQLGDKERFLLAQLYLEQSDQQLYQDQMIRLLNVKVKDPRHLVHFIDYWIGRNQLNQADRWLAELKKAEPQGLAALEREARLLDLRKRKPELLALLEARRREVPDQTGRLADLLSRFGFVKEAETAYKAFVACEPRQPERSLALAGFLAREDRIAEAMAILKKAWLTCRPEQVAATALLLFDAHSVGEADKRQVEAWLAETVRTRPKLVVLASKLGVIWIRQGRFGEAEGSFRQILASEPDNVDALNNLAWLLALRDESKTREALVLIDRAIEAHGPAPSLIDTRAVVLIRAGQFDKAIEELTDARDDNGQNPSFALHLAWAYQSKGQLDLARRAFQQAVALGYRPEVIDPLERPLILKLRRDIGWKDNLVKRGS